MSQASAEDAEVTVALSDDASVDSKGFAQRLSELANNDDAVSNEELITQPQVDAETNQDPNNKEDQTQENALTPESLLVQINDSQNFQTVVTPSKSLPNGEALPLTQIDENEVSDESKAAAEDEKSKVVAELKIQSAKVDLTEGDDADVESELAVKLTKASSELSTVRSGKKIEDENAVVAKQNNLETLLNRQSGAKEDVKSIETTAAKNLEATPQVIQNGKISQEQEIDKDNKVQIKLAESLTSIKPNTESPTIKVDMAKAMEVAAQASTEPTPIAERVNQLQAQNPLSLHQIATPEGKVETPQLHVSLRQGNEQVVQMQDMIKRFSPVMKQQMVAMVNKGIGQAEIRLDPPELGHMMVRIQVQNDQTQVQFQVATPQARDLLEHAQPRLREMLAEQGLHLADSQISHHNDGRNNQQGNGQDNEQGSSRSNHYTGTEQQESEQLTLKVSANSSSVIDYYA
ncbi:flagellar hook-length control protein FliK [Parashewanella curva]|uniref:Flagellar hook-length control protein FliK n=2 Tax=Parashewanella curva TaxID=2338552 RepID=A0A3L8Q3V1_9GAMM|nr:flagellar hook-length control protein FliK [Parashewanella curva]